MPGILREVRVAYNEDVSLSLSPAAVLAQQPSPKHIWEGQ